MKNKKHSSKIELLKRAMPSLSDSVVETLADFENILEYPGETTLCKQGNLEKIAYILLEGKVDIYKYESGEMYHLDSMTSGIFGELALLFDAPRSADVVTANDVKVIEISREEFLAYSQTNPDLAIELSALLVQRMLEQVNNLLKELSRYRKPIEERPSFFISYSHKDKVFVLNLAGDLRRRGIRVWLDEFDIDPGQSWSRQIGSALDSCDQMLLVWSPNALASENVDDEWNYFLDVKKTVLPILIEPCDLPYRLHKLQYIDFYDVEYRAAINNLVAYLMPQMSANQ